MVRRHATSVGRWAWLGAVMVVLGGFLVLAVPGPAEAQSRCGTIQGRVNNAPAGARINLPDNCVYRETVTINKPLTLQGGRGVEIRGSNVWTNWGRSGRFWVKGTIPRFGTLQRIPDPQHPYPCRDKTRRCLWPAQVFFDGRPLVQVASRPRSGQFAVNGARKIVLANDPRGHKVEVTVRTSWIVGRSGNVTVENFTMKHAGNGAETAAINNHSRPNWTVRNNDLSWAHGANLGLSHAPGLSIVGNNIHHGGQLGIISNKGGVAARYNHVHGNNTEGFYPGWSAGGIKVNGAPRAALQNNRVHHNDWNGIWIDNGSRNILISGNRVYQNVKKGVQFEISDGGRIYRNVVWGNGRGVTGGGGIHTIASRSVRVYGNTLAWNRGRSIYVENSDRSGTRYDLVSNVRVHHNTILAQVLPPYAESFALDWRRSYSRGNLYNPAAGNRGYGNRYWYAGAEVFRRYRFYWTRGFGRLGAFNTTLGEQGGRYLSALEKRRVTAAAGVPALPGR